MQKNRGNEKKRKSVCVLLGLDTGIMKVSKMRGSGYDDKRCVWCRDGKEKLEPDQLVDVNMVYNQAIDDVLEAMKTEEQIKLIKKLIAVIRKDYISKCEQEKDRDKDCLECLACECVEFLKRHIKNLKYELKRR